MNIFIKGVCFGLGFLVVMLLITMVGSINDTKEVKTEDVKINMAIFEDSFIKSCIGDDKTDVKSNYCHCSYDYIISILGEEETVKEAEKIPTTGLSTRMMEVMTGAIDKCTN